MDEEPPKEGTIDFIPSICFLKRGIAKERPEKVVLSPEELARVIQETREDIGSDLEEDDDDEDEDEAMETEEQDVQPAEGGDEFQFDNYDQEDNSARINLGDVAVIDENQQLQDEQDSEDEDELIKATDNLIIVGHVSDDSASLEVWVFNEEEESLYVHHDFFLPSFPLCIEWLSHDPGSETDGNLVAIGAMDPVITVWDLDIQDSMEPAMKLGSKKKSKEKYGHTDAVLDLSWNHNFNHIIASGSADKSVILWDLDEGVPHTTIKSFSDIVQSIQFHPVDSQSLLTGSADGFVKLFDCRATDSIDTAFVQWKLTGQVEKVLFNPISSNYFVAGGSDGKLYYSDVRKPGEFLWTTEGHEDEISGVCFNSKAPNMLNTTGADGILKIWKFTDNEVRPVYSHDMELGRIQCMQQSPDDPFTLAFGGEKNPKCRVYNIKNFEAVRRTFDIPSVLE